MKILITFGNEAVVPGREKEKIFSDKCIISDVHRITNHRLSGLKNIMQTH